MCCFPTAHFLLTLRTVQMALDEFIYQHLFIPPLRPKVPSHGGCDTKEGKYHEQPEEAIHKAEVLVEDVADSMDGALFCKFLGCLAQIASHCWILLGGC